MSIATIGAVVTAAGNGSTTVFSYNFIIPYALDGVTPLCQVWYTGTSGIPTLLASNQYTISGVGNPAGGTVTYNPSGTPIPAGTFLSIIRTVPYNQPYQVPNQSFFPNTIEQIADYLVMQIQQILAEDAFVLRVPETDPVAPAILPSYNLRANKLFGFDSNGQPLMVSQGGSGGGGGGGNYVIVNINAGNSPFTPGNANVIFADATAGDVHINIPPASQIDPLWILRLDNSNNFVYLDAFSGNTINSVASYPLVSQNQSVMLLPNGATFWGIF